MSSKSGKGIRPALEHGIFSEPGYLSVGDQYKAKPPKADDGKMPPIVVPTRAGKLFDEKPPRAFKVRRG